MNDPHHALSVGLGIPRSFREQDGMLLGRNLDVTMPVVRFEANIDKTAWIATYMAGTLNIENVFSKKGMREDRADPPIFNKN